MKITAIYGSPRKGGNSDLLMQAFLRGLQEAGGSAQEVFLRDLHIQPCIGCNGCEKTGICVLKDDMDQVYPLFENSDMLILAASVFFYGFGALAKAMVDRSQAFWMRKYRLEHNLQAARETGAGRGILLSVGGAKGKRNFEGILLSARYFFDAIDMQFAHHITYGSVDERGAILQHPTACDDAFQLGTTVMGER